MKKKNASDFTKIKFSSDDNLLLNKQLKFHNLTIIVRSVFEQDDRYYPQVFSDDCLYELQMIQYERVDISEGIDINKLNKPKECMIYHYWCFKNSGYKHEPYVCNECHDLSVMVYDLNDFMILNIKGVDYRCYVFNMSKNDAIKLLRNSVLDNKGVL